MNADTVHDPNRAKPTATTKPKWLALTWLAPLSAVVALLTSINLWPQPAHADWRSLTGLLPEFTNSPDFIISPDSRTVAFTADIVTDSVTELFAVPITGSNPIKLNPPLVADGNVQSSRMQFTPDSQSVIYLADQEVDNVVNIYSVPISGGQSIQLNPPLVAGGNVIQFKIDEKNNRAVYLADQVTNEAYELWSVPFGGGSATRLNGDLVAGGNVGTFLFDPLSNRVVYNADQETNGKGELYSAPLLGGPSVKLNPPIVLTGGGDSGICCGDFAVDPVVPYVVFIARQAGATGGRLFSIPTVGDESLRNQLSFELLPKQRLIFFRISPSGDRVVFSVATGTDDIPFPTKGNLYSNLIGAGGAANVTETADPLFGTDNFRFLPNGSRVIYSFQNNEANSLRLESATPLGERLILYDPGLLKNLASGFDISPDSNWVTYRTLSNGQLDGLFAVPPTSSSAVGFGSVTPKLFTPDSSRIDFTRVVSIENRTDLFSSQIFGGGERNLSGLDGTGYVGDAKASPDGKWIVFETTINNQYELRVSDGAEAQAPTATPTVTLTPTLTPTQTATPTLTPAASGTPPLLSPQDSLHLPNVMR